MQATLLAHPSEQLQDVEIALDPEILGALYRRGRRRLRDIQNSTQATLKLDRVRGVLRATGTKESIEDVQRQLESVSGSHVAVTAAVWAELMRTRADPDVSLSAVARIQHESGCRIHIERNAQQVQLFGPRSASFLAHHLVVKFEHMCIEKVVEMKCPRDHVFLQKLQVFAEDFGVTLQVSETSILILGVRGAVVEAAKELQDDEFKSQYLDSAIDFRKPSGAARTAINMAMSNLTVDADKRIASTTMVSPLILQNAGSKRGSDISMQGAVTLKASALNLKSSFQQQIRDMNDTDLQQAYDCPTCGGCGTFCINCGRSTGSMMQGSPAGCPTCGCVNFCGFCGQRTDKKMLEIMNPLQHRASGGSPYTYEPAMFCSDSMQMMTMLPVQPTMQTTLQPTGQPMMQSSSQTAMQSGVNTVSSPTSQQVLVQVAIPCHQFFPYDASNHQYLPVFAGN